MPFRGQDLVPPHAAQVRRLNGCCVVRQFVRLELFRDLCKSRTSDRHDAACVVPDSLDRRRFAVFAGRREPGACRDAILSDGVLDLA